MRWYWIDRFVEFESGRRAVALKCISLSEDHLQNHYSGYPVMPNSLVIEGLAQTGGLLIGEHYQFQERVILAKIPKARFLEHARPGDTLTYTATIEDINKDGARITTRAHIKDCPQAEVDMVFAHLNARNGVRHLFKSSEFLAMLKVFRLYEVGKKPDGSPLEIPPHLAEAERAARAPASG